MTAKTVGAGELLSPQQLAVVRERSDLRGTWLVVHAWGVIFLSMAMFAWFPNPLTFIAAVVLIGGRQLGLAILMHDGAHGILTKNQKLNMFLSQWFCAYPMLAETGAYRRYHLKHHANTQQQEDPDLILSAPFPITKKSFRRKVIRDLTGQTGYQQRKAQFLNAIGPSDWPLSQRLANFNKKLGKSALTNAALFAILWAAGHPWYFVTLWVLPLLTWHQFITRVRNIAEHAMVDDDDPFRYARTTRAGLFMRAVLAPYWVNYHVEHHLMMWVPCYNLPRAQAYLFANGFGERMEIKDSYFDVIRMATSRPDSDDRPGELKHNARRRRVEGSMGEGFEPSQDAA